MILAAVSVSLVDAFVLTGATLAAGKPGGTVSNPELVYINRSNQIEVANADGSAKTVVLPAATQYRHHNPNWSPLGDGSAGDPYRIVYESPGVCNKWLNFFDLVIQDGIPTATNVQENVPTSGQSCAPAYSRDGGELVYADGYQEAQSSRAYVLNTNDGNETVVYDAPPNWGVFFATFSTNGRKVAFVESLGVAPYSKRIKILDRDSGAVAEVLGPNVLQPQFLEWHPTLDVLAFNSGFNIYTLDIPATGSPPPAPVLLIPNGAAPSWSRTGDKLAFEAQNGVAVYNFATGKITVVARGGKRPKFRK
jgi:Tol biopolymer transport system component